MKRTVVIVMGVYIVVMACVITVCSIEQANGDEPRRYDVHCDL